MRTDQLALDELRALLGAVAALADEVNMLPDDDLVVLFIKCALLRRLNAVIDLLAAAVDAHVHGTVQAS